MNIEAFYIIFHPPRFRKVFSFFGHVQICGYTADDTWFFYDPARPGGDLDIVHKKDTVELYLAIAFGQNLVLRTEKTGALRLPIWPMMNCATVCAHMTGMRAFTPWGLKRKLLRNGSEVIYDGRTKGIEGVEGSAPA